MSVEDTVENVDVPSNLNAANNISDDELMNMSPEDFDKLMETDTDDKEDADATSEQSEEETSAEGSEDSDSLDETGEEEEASTEEKEEESEEDELESDDDDDGTADSDDTFSEDEKEEEDSDKSTEEETDDTSSVEDSDKIAAYDRLMGKIRANGVDIQPETVDDAIRLMQMGAGFHKRMAQIKPVRKIGKMLENNDLLNEDKVNFLIDLSKGDPEAITKLIKDNGIDPLDLDVKSDTEYKSKAYNASDLEVDLQDTLEGIQDTDSGKRLLDVVSNKWDAASRQTMAKHPSLFNVINGHIEGGFFDQITAKVESERALGRLDGLSDLEAYHQVGEQMFSKQQQTQADEKSKTPVTKTVKKVDKTKLSKRKKAAKVTKQTTKTPPESLEKLLDLSDEDFEKQMASVKF